ncbi:hypothetical protein SORDD15_00673 [Streptococcus oralis]|uniref:Uncharacterized protein n=1 Tax=Streptococcus oralis TaxID=1303 RepID=A0A139NZJ2_STROR|nr:hypothetical protein SORDD15_00673 [Streptococcus oralis]
MSILLLDFYVLLQKLKKSLKVLILYGTGLEPFSFDFK